MWPFASGCQDAEWIGGACVVTKGGAPLPALEGPGPMTRMCLMPAAAWRVHDTWHGFGLRSTGSHHVELRDVFVPERNVLDFPFGASFAPDPVFGMFPELVMLSHGAAAVGMAEGALADLIELAGSGIAQWRMAAPLVETERFQEGVGRLGASSWRRARCSTGRQPNAGRPRSRARRGTWPAWPKPSRRRFGLPPPASASPKAASSSPGAGRRLRDLRVAAQHAIVHGRNYVAAGGRRRSRTSAATLHRRSAPRPCELVDGVLAILRRRRAGRGWPTGTRPRPPDAASWPRSRPAPAARGGKHVVPEPGLCIEPVGRRQFPSGADVGKY